MSLPLFVANSFFIAPVLLTLSILRIIWQCQANLDGAELARRLIATISRNLIPAVPDAKIEIPGLRSTPIPG